MAIQPAQISSISDRLLLLLLDAQKAAGAFETFIDGIEEIEQTEPLKDQYKNELTKCLLIFQNFFITNARVLKAQNGSHDKIDQLLIKQTHARDRVYKELLEMVARAQWDIPIDPQDRSVEYRKDILEKEVIRITQMINADFADSRYLKLIDQLVITLRTIPDFNSPDFVAFLKRHLIKSLITIQ